MNVKQLLAQYAAGKRDFRWCDLREANLRGANLSGINLVQANLTQAQLQQADLSHANLYKANLTRANFRGANLHKANLRRTQLTEVVWDGANLDSAIFSANASHTTPVAETLTTMVETDRSDLKPESVAVGDAIATRSPSADWPDSPVIETEPQSHLATPLSQSWRKLPFPSLILLAGGYSCFGLLLGSYQTGVGAWLVVFSSALICLWDESLVWFVPVYGAIALMIALGVSAWSLLLVASLMSGLIISLMVLGWSPRRAIKNSLWVGGIAAVLINVAQWLFVGYGNTIIVSGRFPLAIFLFLGIGGTGVGATAWLQMQNEGFGQRAIATGIGLCARLSLAMGYGLGYLLTSQ